MKDRMRLGTTWIAMLAAGSLFVAAGCGGGGGGDNGGGTVLPTTDTDDDGGEDAADTGVDTVADTAADVEPDVAPDTSVDPCSTSATVDLKTLEMARSGKTSDALDLSEGTDQLTTEKTEDGKSGPERVLTFEVPEPAAVEFELTSRSEFDSPVMEVREGGCDGSVVASVDGPKGTVEFQSSGTYYLIVEGKTGTDSGSFEVSWDNLSCPSMAVEDLGEVADGDSYTSPSTVELSKGSDLLAVQNENAEGPERIFRLKASGSIEVDFDLKETQNMDALLEVRKKHCKGETLGAADRLPLTTKLQAGSIYYLLVQDRRGRQNGSFKLTYQATKLACPAAGKQRCVSDKSVEICESDGWASYTCGTTCAQDVGSGKQKRDECRGSSCAAPIRAPNNKSFKVDAWAPYLGLANFSSTDSCGPGSGGTAAEGKEVIVALPGVKKDETVRVKTKNAGCDLAMFILPSCPKLGKLQKGACKSGHSDAKRCCAAEPTADTLEWTAQQKGDYFLLVDQES
ncbi:MAG: hypothetical protein ABEL76_06125, partial [Bradymonadaceae bacterium]